MIATLNGIVAEKLQGSVIIETNGLGYGVVVTTEDYGRLHVGEQARVYIYEHIREAAYDLFAFLHRDTKTLFEQLLGVNGVGPKMAISILCVGNAGEVRAAIATGDVKFIQQASGVGRRVAERIVVDMKDKVGLEGVDIASSGLLQSESLASKDEAAAALMALGFSPQDAAKALHTVNPDLPTEDRIKQALRGGR